MTRKILLVALAIFFAALNFVDADINQPSSYNHIERYDASLDSLNTMNKLEHFVDLIAKKQGITPGSEKYPLLLSYIISFRFYHGFSHWKLNENWIAAVAEKLSPIGFSCKVQPDAIMANPHAACSQQALVMMEVLRRKKIDYRKVGFPHHYAIEVNVNGVWYYFDPNMEPYMNLAQRNHNSWNMHNDSLKIYYDPAKHSNLSYQFGNGQMATFGPVNEIPAKNLRLFQSVTSILSKTLWLLPLIILFYFDRLQRRKRISVI